MELKRCSRCGKFFTSDLAVCQDCTAKDNLDVAKLRGYIEEKLTNAYSITSAINYNVIANNLLTCPPPGDFYNFIKMGEKLKFDGAYQ